MHHPLITWHCFQCFWTLSLGLVLQFAILSDNYFETHTLPCITFKCHKPPTNNQRSFKQCQEYLCRAWGQGDLTRHTTNSQTSWTLDIYRNDPFLQTCIYCFCFFCNCCSLCRLSSPMSVLVIASLSFTVLSARMTCTLHTSITLGLAGNLELFQICKTWSPKFCHGRGLNIFLKDQEEQSSCCKLLVLKTITDQNWKIMCLNLSELMD